jgi:SAM-dependent methyltransferase
MIFKSSPALLTANHPDAVRRMYATDESLRVRQMIHEQHSVPPGDFIAWALSSVQWRGDERVLDAGCGPGGWAKVLLEHLPAIQYYGLDLSPGMMRNHPQRSRSLIGDAVRLPYPDAAFDVVMANHMLFHMQDIDATLSELRRVLKPNGYLMATSNSVHNLPEFQQLLRRAITLLVPPGTSSVRVPAQHTDLFSLESGTRALSRHFYAVVRYDLPRLLVFKSAEPIIAYIDSTRLAREGELPPGVVWDDMMMIVREQVNRLIEHFGEIACNTLSGLLVATDQGDFIRDYVTRETTRSGPRTTQLIQAVTVPDTTPLDEKKVKKERPRKSKKEPKPKSKPKQ